MGRLSEALEALEESRGIHRSLGVNATRNSFEVLCALAKVHLEFARGPDTADDTHKTAAFAFASEAKELATRVNLNPEHPSKVVRRALALITEVLETDQGSTL
jgi:hypothetical protein